MANPNPFSASIIPFEVPEQMSCVRRKAFAGPRRYAPSSRMSPRTPTARHGGGFLDPPAKGRREDSPQLM